MGEHVVPVLLITANVGSVFENVSEMRLQFAESFPLTLWICDVSLLDPKAS